MLGQFKSDWQGELDRQCSSFTRSCSPFCRWTWIQMLHLSIH